MGVKTNPLLAKYEANAEAKARARYQVQLSMENEFNLIAHILACDEEFEPNHDQIGRVLNGFFESKQDVAAAILKDDDKQLEHTRCDIARRLKQTLGPDNWQKYKHLFLLLQEFWDMP